VPAYNCDHEFKSQNCQKKTQQQQQQKETLGLVVECFPEMYKALGLIPSTTS
jgi:hypothetical protein